MATSPVQLRCWFSKELDKASTMTVLDATGNRVDNDDAHIDLNDVDRKQMVVTLNSAKMKDGVYTVKWKSLDAEDKEEDEGEFSFTVRAGAGTLVSPTTATPAAAIPQATTAATPRAISTTSSTPQTGLEPFSPWLFAVSIGAVVVLIGVAWRLRGRK